MEQYWLIPVEHSYYIMANAGEIAERSRVSKTQAVEQEVPSSNPGEGTFIVATCIYKQLATCTRKEKQVCNALTSCYLGG